MLAPCARQVALNEYSAQDFWVYTGRELAEPISYLQPIFAQRATPGHVDKALHIGDSYWSWAKNQAFEHHEVMDGAFHHPACDREILAFQPEKTKYMFYALQHLRQGVLHRLPVG